MARHTTQQTMKDMEKYGGDNQKYSMQLLDSLAKKIQEFEEEDPMEEESKETNDYAEAESPMRWNDDLTGYYEDT